MTADKKETKKKPEKKKQESRQQRGAEGNGVATRFWRELRERWSAVKRNQKP